MKWYSTEKSQGKVDYSVSDAMLKFTKRHRISVRGHNVFWDDPKYQPWWVHSLSRKQLALATFRRLNSLMSRYKGQLIGWDVVNENLHFDFFERQIARSASAIFYNWAKKADETTSLYLNEFNTIEESGDTTSSPVNYIRKIREIKKFRGNGNVKMAIGVEGHFSSNSLNLPYMRAALDTLAAGRLPIWITEVDVQSSPKQVIHIVFISVSNSM